MTPEAAAIKPQSDVHTCNICRRLTADEVGYHQSCIDRKHIRLRGSLKLLYTLGTAEATCQARCTCGQYHPCFLRDQHNVVIGHKFTSECGA